MLLTMIYTKLSQPLTRIKESHLVVSSMNNSVYDIVIAGMPLFLKNITFEEGNSDWLVVADLLSQSITQGAVRPLNTTVFNKTDVEGAFRFMAQVQQCHFLAPTGKWEAL